MPVQKCKDGYKFGETGKCYKKKSDAIKQGFAIYKSSTFDDDMSFAEFLRKEDLFETLEFDNVETISEISLPSVDNWKKMLDNDYNDLKKDIDKLKHDIDFFKNTGVSPNNKNQKKREKDLTKKLKKMEALNRKLDIVKSAKDNKDYTPSEALKPPKIPKQSEPKLNKFEIYTDKYKRLVNDIETLRHDIEFFEKAGAGLDNKEQLKRLRGLEKLEKKLTSLEGKKDFITNYDTDIKVKQEVETELDKLKKEAQAKQVEKLKDDIEFEEFASSNKLIRITLGVDQAKLKAQLLMSLKGGRSLTKGVTRKGARKVLGDSEDSVILSFSDNIVDLYIKNGQYGENFTFTNTTAKGDYNKYLNKKSFYFAYKNLKSINQLLSAIGFFDVGLKSKIPSIGKLERSEKKERSQEGVNKGTLNITVKHNKLDKEKYTIYFNKVEPHIIAKNTLSEENYETIIGLTAQDMELEGSDSVIFYRNLNAGEIIKQYNYPASVQNDIKREDFTNVKTIKDLCQEEFGFEITQSMFDAYSTHMLGFIQDSFTVYRNEEGQTYKLRSNSTGYLMPLVYLMVHHQPVNVNVRDFDSGKDKVVGISGEKVKTPAPKEGYTFIRKNSLNEHQRE